MSFTDIAPILGIVLFWAILFVFAFWMSVRALRAPTDTELETHAEETKTAHL